MAPKISHPTARPSQALAILGARDQSIWNPVLQGSALPFTSTTAVCDVCAMRRPGEPCEPAGMVSHRAGWPHDSVSAAIPRGGGPEERENDEAAALHSPFRQVAGTIPVLYDVPAPSCRPSHRWQMEERCFAMIVALSWVAFCILHFAFSPSPPFYLVFWAWLSSSSISSISSVVMLQNGSLPSRKHTLPANCCAKYPVPHVP